jgi:2-dehydro-3-deoxyphosphooctonate aldolase (KDO 8-P synthase)
MSRESCSIGSIVAGGGKPLVLIAGPCVLETAEIDRRIATTLKDLSVSLGVPLVFKASFDKANRTSVRSARGPGLRQGLDRLAAIREEIDVPVTTDVHEPAQAAPVAQVVDLLQVPAFLCRQTDLLTACAATGRPVNVKKGQFLSPQEMAHVVAKLREAGARGIMLTERGTFFGYQRLVNDFIGLGDLMELGPPVCFDVTHSTQLPGAGPDSTGGRPERAPILARAAAAAGVDALFVECHPDPPRARSDASTQQPLSAMRGIVQAALAIRATLAELAARDDGASGARPARPRRQAAHP